MVLQYNENYVTILLIPVYEIQGIRFLNRSDVVFKMSFHLPFILVTYLGPVKDDENYVSSH